MIEIYVEILRTIACRGIVAKCIAGALSVPADVESIIAPLCDLMAAGLVETFMDRGRTRYQLTHLDKVVTALVRLQSAETSSRGVAHKPLCGIEPFTKHNHRERSHQCYFHLPKILTFWGTYAYQHEAAPY